MALDAIDFIDAFEDAELDRLGFSTGSFLAQEIALVRPAIGTQRSPRRTPKR